MQDPNREFFYTDEFRLMNGISKDLFYIIVRMSKNLFFIKRFDRFFERDNIGERIHGNNQLKTFSSFEEAAMYCDLLGYKLITRQQVKLVTRKNESGYDYTRFSFI